VSACRSCGREALGYPRCCWHTKAEVDWRSRPPPSNGLSDEERAWIGLYRPRPRDGWQPADGWVRSLDPDPEIDVERTAMLHWLASMSEEPSV
jgi:hypothetical protein